MSEAEETAKAHELMRESGWLHFLVIRGWTARYGTDEGDSIEVRYEPGQVRPFGPRMVPDLLKAGAVIPAEH